MNTVLASRKRQKTLHVVQEVNSRDIIISCSVALAQHFVHLGIFPQQPRRARLHEAQHAFLGSRRFGPQARQHDKALFVCVGWKKAEIFSQFAFGGKGIETLLKFDVCF